MKKRLARRHVEEAFVKLLMYGSFALVAGSVGAILVTIMTKGLPSLDLDMLTKTPKGGYYLGKEGGILNAITGSLCLAAGGTVLALLIGLPIALYLEIYVRRSKWASAVRLFLDVLWGIPSIVYGAFGFTLMLALGLRGSLLAGIIVLAILELPIITRAIDEVVKLVPLELTESAYALGTTRLETSTRIILRQVMPGVATAILLAFGRGIGDAASVLFTAGYTDRMPTSLMRPVASLPLAVFFQLGTPFPEVRRRAYAAAVILTIVVLIISLGSRWLASRLSRHVVR